MASRHKFYHKLGNLRKRLEFGERIVYNSVDDKEALCEPDWENLYGMIEQFEPETDIAGVILNNVSGSRHEGKLRTAVEHYCGIPVLGSIPRDSTLYIPQRHLGIIPYREAQDSALVTNRIYHCLKDHLDLDGILAVARGAGCGSVVDVETPAKKPTVVRIGVMLDRVFTFYYPENLEALTQAGADLVFIDSLRVASVLGGDEFGDPGRSIFYCAE